MAKNIILKGLRQNNLKNIELEIPVGSFSVVCGPSGSGKSSLAFETLYAEGQRRYINSLSNYTRQFLNKAPKPDVDLIDNIPPAIAIEQSNSIKNSRSTVGTSTEIIDYLRILFSRIGHPICPNDNTEIISDSAETVLKQCLKKFEGKRGYILFPIQYGHADKIGKQLLKVLLQDGFLRYIESVEDKSLLKPLDLNANSNLPKKDFYVVVDRLAFTSKDKSRIFDSIRTAYLASQRYNHFSGGRCIIVDTDGNILKNSEDLACSTCDFSLPPISSSLFNFSSPVGACKACNGFGNILELDPDKIIPNSNLSIKKGAIFPFTMPSAARAKTSLNKFCKDEKINTDISWQSLPQKDKDKIWNGFKKYKGIKGHFERLEEKKYKMHVRVFLARFKSPQKCPECIGTRLSNPSKHIFINNKNINDICNMSIDDLHLFFNQLKLKKMEQEIASEILLQLRNRIEFLIKVGLNYINLARESRTLSGGEYQRIKLANQLGMGLSQTLYVLDEPTIGLHPRDNQKLIDILIELNNLGNTLVVVEHDKEVIKNASHIIEMGPLSGIRGGELMFFGDQKTFNNSKTKTSNYIKKSDEKVINTSRKALYEIELNGCKGHNLKNVDIKIPLQQFTVVTGVSGSGKSSLIQSTLYPALARALETEFPPCLEYKELKGSEYIKDVLLIDQKSIGKTGRSNPATYMGIFDEIRKLLANTSAAKKLSLSPGYFSLNVDGGRCPKCRGDGYETIDMQFMDDVVMLCEDCKGKRYKKDTLEIKYNEKNIHEILSLTIEEAEEFFVDSPKIRRGLNQLSQVGLHYIQLGQAANTLSGGESQRLKIAKEFSKASKQSCLYILDEPTTGLHFEEIEILVKVLHKLVDSGSTVLIIEHNTDLISQADYIIDVGPSGGIQGGEIVYQGPLNGIFKANKSITKDYLRK